MLIISRSSLAIVNDDLYYINPLSKSMIFFINEKANTTWRAGPSKFDDWSMASIKRLMGVPLEHMGHVSSNLNVVKHDLRNINDLPENFDSREQWPNCPTLQEVRDQGNCGSCWAISAVETMSDRYLICIIINNYYHKKYFILFLKFRICISSSAVSNAHLSTEDMVSCCHICGFGCNGGYPQMAWEYFKRTGVCTGGNYGSDQVNYI